MSTVRPYGHWPSPVRPEDLASSASVEGLTSTGDALWFTRTDPGTGQQRLHRWDGVDVVARTGLDVRSRVHEYGGGALAGPAEPSTDGTGPASVVVVDFAEQQLHRVGADGDAETLTAPTGARTRWGDGVVLADGRLVAVRETHDGDTATEVRNELVLLDPADGTASVLVGDADLVAAPTPGPDGWLAWLTWGHPDMPWDSATLWAGRLDGTTLHGVRAVAGGDGVSVSELAWWGRDLLCTEDSTGFWELWHHRLDGSTTRVTDEGADLGRPRWTLGGRRLAVLADPADPDRAEVVVARTREGATDLRLVGLTRTADGSVRPASTRAWPVPTGQVAELTAHAGGVATVETDPDGGRAVRLRTLDGGVTTVAAVAPPTDRPGDLGPVQAITVGEGEQRTHAFLHLPANADATGPQDQAPPLVVFLHGGPTGHTLPVRTAAIAYWTTRGFAVADVNYRGSAGFGRAYRDALRGRWGESEVADVIAVATELARRGLVDGDKMAVRGGSAGGFTTLAVLTAPEHPFACGTSFFGVADLAALAAFTHKFESRYLDRLVGPLPEAAAVYRERSPLSHVDRLSVPLLVLQGTEDKVVPPEQSEVVVEAARAKGLLHDYLLFPGEGHGFRRPEHVAAWHRAELDFYRTVMGLGEDSAS
ncbi:prolyl oligopeptidase family serine peptidase [Desertihabitans brevis]|uniref:prolyl oligopeptidase family serine peptidase n=1 Tax=Desertihabitans brevis TaxID=2268447 RepID=UPI001315034B|nr:prolyl oligopeptidase family serine peptidase [Desertihabitans brevis]